jgi:hypothetical protein
MNAMSKSSKNGGCGCGGGGSKSGGCGCGGGAPAKLCGCGDVGCTTCRNQGFVRPKFFAGQLLTEEDLQKLVDYVVSKNRLHNQRLWGDGVVCGLEVTCEPCGGGWVTVKPGYALDCCGNDLLLGCPQKLDINAMVRDLKRSLRDGQDCGDPCAPPRQQPSSTGTYEVIAGGIRTYVDAAGNRYHVDAAGVPIVKICPVCGAQNSAAGPFCTKCGTDLAGIAPTQIVVSEEVSLDTTRHYCLYLRYCENETDPVSPYATDEGCSYQACQSTRVSEGVSFELRCNECCKDQSNILDRICECIGDVDSATQTDNYARVMSSISVLESPVADVEMVDASIAAKKFLYSVKVAGTRLPSDTGQPSAIGRKVAAEKEADKKGIAVLDRTVDLSPSDSADSFEAWLSELHTVDAHLASYYLVRPKANEAKTKEELEGSVELGAKELATMAAQLRRRTRNLSVPELARRNYEVAIEITIALANKAPEQERLLQIQKGRLLGSEVVSKSTASMKAMREELLDRLDRSPRFGDCLLQRDVEAIRISETEEADKWLTARTLKDAWRRYLKDCTCVAINPPCVECNDMGVLLACIEVKDCEVIEICNLKRKFVLSPPALRYWLPQINELGETVEKLCCPDPICITDEPISGLTRKSYLDSSKDVFGMEASSMFDFRLFELLCRKRRKASALREEPAPSSGSLVGSHKNPLATFDIGQMFGSQRVETYAALAEALRADPNAYDFIGKVAEEKVAAALKKVNASTARERRAASKQKAENKELKKKNTDLTKQVTALAAQAEKSKEGTSS